MPGAHRDEQAVDALLPAKVEKKPPEHLTQVTDPVPAW
jgi:hypothetical protein